jgi:hypothetical protein
VPVSVLRETTKTITIEVNGDSKKEADETLYSDLLGNFALLGDDVFNDQGSVTVNDSVIGDWYNA